MYKYVASFVCSNKVCNIQTNKSTTAYELFRQFSSSYIHSSTYFTIYKSFLEQMSKKIFLNVFMVQFHNAAIPLRHNQCIGLC